MHLHMALMTQQHHVARSQSQPGVLTHTHQVVYLQRFGTEVPAALLTTAVLCLVQQQLLLLQNLTLVPHLFVNTAPALHPDARYIEIKPENLKFLIYFHIVIVIVIVIVSVIVSVSVRSAGEALVYLFDPAT